MAEKSRTSWKEKTKKEHEIWIGHFVQVIGDRPVDGYTKADARAFKAVLMKLPANWNKVSSLKEFKRIDKVAEKAEALGLAPMSDKNLNKLLGFVGSFFRWVESNYDQSPGNIFGGLKLTIKTKARDDRNPFTVDELNKIFRAPLFTGCMSLRNWKQAGDFIPKDSGRYWVPLISLYTGARAGEAIQLYTTDIKISEDGMRYFDMNSEGEDKSLKTESSNRNVPIHSKLIELGFMELVEARRRAKVERLFPDLEKGADGYYSSVFGKFFNNNFLVSIGVKHAKNSFHSFRHSFEDACRDCDIPKEIMDAFQGHISGDMSGRYGRGYK